MSPSLSPPVGPRPVLDPLDHFDHLGSRGMAGGEAGAAPRAEMRRQIAREGWWNETLAVVVFAKGLLSAILPVDPPALWRDRGRSRRLSNFSIGTALAASLDSAVSGRVWPGLASREQAA